MMGMPSESRIPPRRPFWDFTPLSVGFWSRMPLPGASLVGPRRLDPWLSDGNVVLAVEGGYFRIHRVVLSSASRVFHDMLSSPQTNKSADRKVDGCPVVTLHDSAPEVQIVLKTLYTRPCVVDLPLGRR
jgi:hypothetical protein